VFRQGVRAQEGELARLAEVAMREAHASSGKMAAHPEQAWDQLAQGAVELLQAQPQLRSLILGGAALGGWVPPGYLDKQRTVQFMTV
jgi:hypothetical protein